MAGWGKREVRTADGDEAFLQEETARGMRTVAQQKREVLRGHASRNRNRQALKSAEGRANATSGLVWTAGGNENGTGYATYCAKATRQTHA
eukprot:4645467-Pleurochrysis_carterae.AAC.1